VTQTAAAARAGHEGGITISEELVISFFAALEAGDIDRLREIYAPDAVVWHNDDLVEQPVEQNLKVLQGLHRAVSGLHYDIIRRVPAPDGVLQQHILRGRLRNGTEVELHAAMYLQVRDGHITRIEEYLDSAKRAAIRAAREALSD
jgi:ketosteroid isomerase-like protein